MTRKRKQPGEYPLRTCRWMDHCKACDRPIVAGQTYHDGGYGRRWHTGCVPAVVRESPKESA